MIAFRLFLENGWVNLAVIVGFLIFCIGLIPMILWHGAPRPNMAGAKVAESQGSGAGSTTPHT